MGELEAKIAEIMETHGGCYDTIPAEVCATMNCQECRTKRILALIAQRETALRSENEALKQQGKAMAEALRAARRRMLAVISEDEQHQWYAILQDDKALLAKIDAVSPKGEGNDG